MHLRKHIAFAMGLVAAVCLAAGSLLGGCTSASGSSSASSDVTSGAPYTVPQTVATNEFDDAAAVVANDSAIDTSHARDGYIGVKGTSSSKLKVLVTQGDMTYNYAVPADGSPVYCPLNMGNGEYGIRVMRNVSGNDYVQINTTAVDVELTDEFQPFLHPNVFCNYRPDSACVKKARELAQGADNEGEVVRRICEYVQENVSYDTDKASRLADVADYVPSPDATLADGTGICFDYAALGAAMLRSLGIPCQVITGYVQPDGIYHAWINVYIDGEWKQGEFSVDENTWSRVDLTFAASAGSVEHASDGKSYTQRYVY